jgi:hypothetical protein
VVENRKRCLSLLHFAPVGNDQPITDTLYFQPLATISLSLAITMRFSSTSFYLLLSLALPAISGNTDQVPMANVEEPHTAPSVSDKPSLADLLTIENSASIFYSYARELQLSEGLSREDFKLTLFVPTNKAVMNLSRKP